MKNDAKQLRVAVIGRGGMGRRHLDAVARAGLSAVAICDVNDSAFAAAERLCLVPPRTYTSWRTLLEQELGRAEVVMIATNGPSHHEIVTAAAQAGYPYILCEKPLSTSGVKAREMTEVCATHGVHLAVNLARRFHDRSIRLKRLVQGQAIGELHHVNVSVGAGGLGCIGTHYFDWVAWLADTHPVWVAGGLDSSPAPNVRGSQFFDPGGRGMVGYANGMTACYQFSGDVAITPVMQIIGSQGYVSLDNWSPPHGGRVEVYARPMEHRAQLKTRFVTPEPVPFEVGEPIDIADATRACLEDLVGAHAENTASGGISAVDTVIGFHLSARRGGNRVMLPLSGEDLLYDVPIT